MAVKLRCARPTDRMAELVDFYTGGLGLTVKGTFEGHDGYDGVILGADDPTWELEFTHHHDGSPAPAPDPESLLVFYVDGTAPIDAIVADMRQLGVVPVAPQNPYWIGKSATFVDPDGFRVVVCDRRQVGG